MRATELEAVVMGRVCVDLYPMQLRVPLEQVEGFHKYVGGFAGNVATGLARLGVRTATEIEHERNALKAMRGDYGDLSPLRRDGHAALAAAER